MTRASCLAHALAHARFAPRQEGEQSAGAQSIQNQARQSTGLRRGSSMAEAIPALEIRNLHKRYGDLEVLKGISLTARDGDVISILGSSGSGKSTFLRCITLLENPHEGEIIVGGEQLKLKRAKDGGLVAADARQINRMRSKLGFVCQNFNRWPHMSVLDNIIEAPRRVLGQSKAEATEIAEALLAKVGIADKRHVYPN